MCANTAMAMMRASVISFSLLTACAAGAQSGRLKRAAGASIILCRHGTLRQESSWNHQRDNAKPDPTRLRYIPAAGRIRFDLAPRPASIQGRNLR
jgi:hypothetical protein